MRSLSVATLTATFIAITSLAEAQTGWTGTVTTLSVPKFPSWEFTAALAVEPNGNAYVVWRRPEAGSLAGTVRIEVARYVAATDSWSAPITLAGPGRLGLPDVAVDTSGNVFFLVPRTEFSGPIDVIRYHPVSGIAITTTLSLNAELGGQVTVDASGNAMVVWQERAGIYAARYDVALTIWGPPVKISDAFAIGWPAVGGLNDVTVVWRRFLPDYTQVIQAVRFDASTGVWGPAIDLSAPGPLGNPLEIDFAGPRIAVDGVGNVTAVWDWGRDASDIFSIRAARFVKAAGTWSDVTELSAPGTSNAFPDVAADPVGNAIAMWSQSNFSVMRVARFNAVTASWSDFHDLPCAGGVASGGTLAMDAAGNALALLGCARSDAGAPNLDVRITASRYTAASNQWGPPIELSAIGQAASVHDIAFDSAGNAVALWLQTAGLVGAIQSTRWVEQPPVPPDPPTDLIVSSVTGNTVTLAWKPSSSSTLTEYVLEGGLSAGSVLGSIKTGNTATSFTFDAPSGVFFVRVHALSGNLRSAASNEIQLVVNALLPPSAPAALLGLVNGSRLALSWSNTFQGGAPTALQLNVTGAQAASIPLGVSETFSFNDVPAGTYTFTLTASNASGVSPPSNAVTLTFPGSCSGPPGVPTYFAVAKSDSRLALTWSPPISGAAVTSYTIHASGAITASLSTVMRSISGTVGPGTYSLSVVAVNECGTSAPTDVVTVTVAPPPSIPDLVVTGIVYADGPLKDAVVEVRGQGGIGANWRVDATTDASGRYRVVINQSFSTTVWVAAHDARFPLQPCAVWFDYGATAKEERIADVRLTATPGPSSAPPAPVTGQRRISGTLYTVAPEGKQPVSDAYVVLDLSSDDVQTWTKTDADGRFALCGLPADRSILIHAYAFQQTGPQAWLVLGPGGDADVELILK
jgi:Fibronectin type III domain